MKKIFIILHVIQTCLCASVSAYHEIFFQKAKKDFFLSFKFPETKILQDGEVLSLQI